MLRCEECGFENRGTDRFCASCGNTLTASDGASAPENSNPSTRESIMPPPVTPGFSSTSPSQSQPASPSTPQPAQTEKTDFDFQRNSGGTLIEPDPEWTMSSLGPPPARKRRLWLWIIIGLLVLCVAVCAGVGIWLGFTDSGNNFWNDIEATATAGA